MNKEILAIVDDFSQWRGNTYTLAVQVAEFVKERAASTIEEQNQELAEIIRGL